MMEGRDTEARIWQRYPLRFLDQGKVEGIPAPLARLTTCGMVTIAVLTEVEPGHPSRGRYEVIPTQTLRGRGAVPALTLLKLLAGRPHRFATSDWLSEQMRGEMEVGALVRLDTIASYLRGLLCGLKAEQQQIDALRVRVVEYLRNGRSSGPGYRLAPYPLIWIDTDALASHVEHGTLMERMGEPTLALPFWERAYHLASKGVYLPDEPSSEWAQDMRERVEGYLHQSVHARSRLSLDEHGQAGEEEVMLLLRTYWQSHKTDEDALRPLMELLGKHERFGEAEQYYQLLLGALQEHGPERQPDQRTRDIREFLRIKHIKREHTQSLPRRSGEQERISAVHLLSEKLITVSSGVNPLIEESTPLALLKPADMSLSIPSLFQTDSDVLTRVSAELRKLSMIREGEMIYFDDQTRLYWRAREETVLPSTTLYAHVIRHIDDINLLLVRSSLPVPRSYLCEIVCRTVLLSGILLYDMGHYVKARQHYQVAFQAATEANNPVLQAIVWGWMSFTWTYAKNYPEALRCVQRARSFAAHTTESMTQAWLGAIESEIQAHLHNRDACLQALSDMERKSGASPSQDISYLFEFHPVLLLGYKGICLQQLYQRQEPATHGLLQEAKESLEQALASEAPLKRRLYYLNDLAGVYARQGEIEAACDYVVQSIPLIMQIGSGSKTIRKHVFQVRLLLQPHEHSAAVQALDEQLVPLLSEIQTESESALA